MLRLLKAISLSLLLGSLPAGLWAQRPSNMEKREVASIRFMGDSAISALELESIIATRTSSGFERFLNAVNSDWGTPRQFIDETTLGEDTIKLFAYYRDRGYFDAHVSDTLHEAPPSPEIEKIKERNAFLPPSKKVPYILEDTVFFRIKEGKSYKVQGFTFEGFERLPMDLQDKITANIGIKQHSQYSKLALQLEIVRAKQILAENGYPFSLLTYTLVEPDTLRKSVTISLRFKTGPRIRIGRVKIMYDTAYSSLGYVQETVIRRQLDLDSGAWYKGSDFSESMHDVSRLGTFQYQNISLDTSSFAAVPDSLRDGMALPVIVTLRMRQLQEVLPGVDLGISAQNQVIAGVELSYTNRNIFNDADNLTLHVSYQLYPLTQHRENIGGDFTIPSVAKNVPLIFSGNYTYNDQYSDISTLQYFERTYVASLGPNIIFHESLLTVSITPKGSFQYVNRDYRDTSLGIRIDTTLLPKQFNTILSSDFTFNWTNDLLNPSRGSFMGLSFQWALPIFNISGLPSAAYGKLTPQFKTFINLGTIEGRSVLGFRLLYGQIFLTHPDESNRDVLIENRYFGGGDKFTARVAGAKLARIE